MGDFFLFARLVEFYRNALCFFKFLLGLLVAAGTRSFTRSRRVMNPEKD